MKIIHEDKLPSLTFEVLTKGDVFKFLGRVYIKTETVGSFNAINCSTALLGVFRAKDLVTRYPDATLHMGEGK